MTYVRPFIRLSFGGELADAEEIWSCNLHLIALGAGSDPEMAFDRMETDLPLIEDELAWFIGQTEVLVPAGVSMKWVKAALVDINGQYMREAVEVPSTAIGSYNGSYIPQASMVNGLVSSKWKDPGKNNRFYLPTYLPVGTRNWALSNLEQTGYAGRLKQFVDRINVIGMDPTETYKYAVGVVSDSGSGHEDQAVQVRVGRIIDTQRRRRNKLTENYVYDTVA